MCDGSLGIFVDLVLQYPLVMVTVESNSMSPITCSTNAKVVAAVNTSSLSAPAVIKVDLNHKEIYSCRRNSKEYGSAKNTQWAVKRSTTSCYYHSSV